jgi:tetratricopeptide (TPR) repeat protein
MKAALEQSSARIYPWFVLWLAFAVICAPISGAGPQSASQTDNILAPPKPNLSAVHWPDLTQLEPDIRTQLVSLQNALTAAVKNSATTEASLSEAYGVMGEAYHAYSLLAPARECYLNAAILASKDFRWVYLLGKLDQQEGRIDDAIRRYRIASRLRPDYVAVPLNLGDIYLQLNRLEEAEGSFKAALQIERSNAAAYYGLGQVALSRRSYSEAINYFERALASAPDANRIHYSLAMAYRGFGNEEKAKDHLSQQGSVGVRPADPLVDGLQQLIKGERVHLIRGRLALEARRYADAAYEFRKAVEANPDSLSAHLNLGAALTQTGDLQEASAQFEAALRIDAENSVAHYNLAVLLARDNRHEPAIDHLHHVLKVYPDDLGARFLLAQELLRSSNLEEALVEFARVVQADANNEEALLEEAKLLLRQKRYKQALDALEKSHAQYPQKGQTAVMLAYLLAASPQSDLRDGKRALELAQLIYKATGLANHGVLVALAFGELGRCDEAVTWMRTMTDKAAQEGKPDLAERLRTELSRYERARSCRPTAEISFAEYLL